MFVTDHCQDPFNKIDKSLKLPEDPSKSPIQDSFSGTRGERSTKIIITIVTSTNVWSIHNPANNIHTVSEEFFSDYTWGMKIKIGLHKIFTQFIPHVLVEASSMLSIIASDLAGHLISIRLANEHALRFLLLFSAL